MTVDEVLAKWHIPGGFDLRLEPAPAGWRFAIREGSGNWSSPRAGHQGFATPTLAATDIDIHLTALAASRSVTRTVARYAALERMVEEERLVPTPRLPDGTRTWLVTPVRGGAPIEHESLRAAVIAEAALPPRVVNGG